MITTKPCTDLENAQKMLDMTDEAYRILYAHCVDPITSFDNVLPSLEEAVKGATVSITALIKIKGLLRAGRLLKTRIISINDSAVVMLKEKVIDIIENVNFEKRIDETFASETEILDTASTALMSIRKKIKSTQSEIIKKLNQYIKSDFVEYLQDGYYTVRSDRYVLPVKAECKGMVHGLLHDRSDSGATLFIEPIQVFELNNTVKELMIEERNEIERILSELSQIVASMSDNLSVIQRICIMSDIVFAKARYANNTNGSKPLLNKEGKIDIRKGRHPLIAVDKVVPLDIRLGDSNPILLISGPNAGGKTVALKSLGLFSLMACSGLFLPSLESSISVFENIYCDIGDEQSIENSLSTFSSHIKSIVHIAKKANPQSLVLLDELGAGTDPTEGAALAIAVIEHLYNKKATALITTHYSGVKEFSMSTSYIKNASMEFDPITFLPTYRLKVGVPGVSNAIIVAGQFGLDNNIIDRAKQYIGESKNLFEEALRRADLLITQAEHQKSEAERILQEAESKQKSLEEQQQKLEEKINSINENAKKDANKIIEKLTQEAESLVEEITELSKDANHDNLLKAKQLRTKLTKLQINEQTMEYEYESATQEDIKVGNTVIIKSLNAQALIKSLPNKKKELEALVGNMIVNVKIDDLAKNTALKHKNTKYSRVNVAHNTTLDKSAAWEINLLGQTVFEAIANVEKFIDGALLSGMATVKIIHGLGTGALRKGLHDYFKTCTQIEDYRLGGHGEGGSGVTILTLRS